MEPIDSFDELLNRFYILEQNVSIAVVIPDDDATIEAMETSMRHGNVSFHAICCNKANQRIQNLEQEYPGRITTHTVQTQQEASQKGVSLVHDGLAGVLMKGSINTDTLLHAVLDKSNGLLPEGSVLTHATLIQAPAYHKLLLFSDAAVIPRPSLPQFRAMIDYDVAIARRLGMQHPNVALIHFSEKTNEKFPHTMDYAAIVKESATGNYGGVNIAGPMDVKTACDRHSAEVKGIESDVTGNADILIFPNLEAANTFYKTVSFFGKATMAGMICGAKAPIILPSRADNSTSKLYSMALACVAGINH